MMCIVVDIQYIIDLVQTQCDKNVKLADQAIRYLNCTAAVALTQQSKSVYGPTVPKLHSIRILKRLTGKVLDQTPTKAELLIPNEGSFVKLCATS